MKKYIIMIAVLCIFIISSCADKCACFSHIVYDMGYTDVQTKPYEVSEFTIPEKFGKVYLKYNELQKQGGYDLLMYRGKQCVRYTYLIPSVDARANIIVYDGKIIGGDICGITLDSIMIPIESKYDKSR